MVQAVLLALPASAAAAGGAEIENGKSGNAVQAKFPLFAFLTDYEIVDEKILRISRSQEKILRFPSVSEKSLAEGNVIF